jgi:L-fuculose-phosphate aldolase
MKSYIKQADEIAKIGRLLYLKNMIAGTEGNISVRLSESEIMVTGSGISKQNLTPEDMVIVDTDGRKICGARQATSELHMHLSVYRRRPGVNACVHSHAPYATSFAVAGVTLPADVLPEMVLFVGDVQLVPYASPGTEQVGKSLESYLNDHNAFLLSNHGVLTIGVDLTEAFHRHEIVEHCAQTIQLARQLGETRAIPKDDYSRLDKMRQEAARSEQDKK